LAESFLSKRNGSHLIEIIFYRIDRICRMNRILADKGGSRTALTFWLFLDESVKIGKMGSLGFSWKIVL
jgi:hypothetical protein